MQNNLHRVAMLVMAVFTLTAVCANAQGFDAFKGTWYGEANGTPFRITLEEKDNQLIGDIGFLTNGSLVSLPITPAAPKDGALTFEVAMPGQDTGKTTIQLRVPERMLVGEARSPQSDVPVSMVMSSEAPHLAEKFAAAKPVDLNAIPTGKTQDACANNLKQLGLCLKMFANENPKTMFPALDSIPGNLMFTPKALFPEYLVDLNIMVCPGDQEAKKNMPADPGKAPEWFLADRDYWYLGYAIGDEATGLAWVEAYKKLVAEKAGFEKDITTDQKVMPEGSKIIYRLREGIERFFITDINDPAQGAIWQSNLPVLIERPGHHEQPGGHVLFLDGHVEFMPYPGKFPMTEPFIKALESLDALTPATPAPAQAAPAQAAPAQAAPAQAAPAPAAAPAPKP